MSMGFFRAAQAFPPLDFFSDIANAEGRAPVTGDATGGKRKWPTKFNWQDPKMLVVDDPVRGPGRKVINMTMLEEYGGGGTSTNNPRGQLQAPQNLYNGAETWISFGLLLPGGYPTPTLAWPDGWNAFFQIHGENATGYPSLRIAFEGLDGFGFRRQPSKGGAWCCQITPQYDAWMDFAIAVHISPDPTVGWMEIWTNFGAGWVQRPLAAAPGDTLDGKRLYTETLTLGYIPGQSWSSHIQNYRKAGQFPSATSYFTDHRQVPIVNYASEAAALAAGTFAALDPASHA